MALTIDELVSRLRFVSNDEALNRTKRGMKGARTEAGHLANTLKSLRRIAIGAFAAMAIGSVLKGTIGFIVSTNKQFEVLRAQLETTTGSATKAETAFLRIRDFARKTPFEVSNLVEAFNILQAVGLDPTNERLTAFGDIAASFGKDITQVAMAVRGAVTGEFEMLKQFGIVARVEGEKLAVTFQGQTTRVNRNGQSVVALLEEIGRTKFAGGMARQSKTLAGVWSNLQDAAAETALKIGEEGLTASLKEAVKELSDVMGSSDELAAVMGEALGEAAEAAVDIFKELLDALRDIQAEDVRRFMRNMADAVSVAWKVVKLLVDNWKALVLVIGGAKAISAFNAATVAVQGLTAAIGAGGAGGLSGALIKLSAKGGPIALTLAALVGLELGALKSMEIIQEARLLALQGVPTARERGLNSEHTRKAMREAGRLARGEVVHGTGISAEKLRGLTDGQLKLARERVRAQAENARIQQQAIKTGSSFSAKVAATERQAGRERLKRMREEVQLEVFANKQRAALIEKEILRRRESRGQASAAIGAGADGGGDGKKKKKTKEDVSAFRQKIDARIDEIAGQQELLAGQRAIAFGMGSSEAEQQAKIVGQQVRARLQTAVDRGNLDRLGGEFSREKQMMRDAGLIDEANRTAPPVLTVSINRFDVRPQITTTVKVASANASAADIGQAVGVAVRKEFQGQIREAMENVVPKQRR